MALGLLRDRVLVGARHDVDAAPEQRLQRPRAAGEVQDLDVETFRLEVALAFGDRQRQIVEKRLAAHTDRELRLFERLRLHGERRDGETSGGNCREDEPATHDFLPGIAPSTRAR